MGFSGSGRKSSSEESILRSNFLKIKNIPTFKHLHPNLKHHHPSPINPYLYPRFQSSFKHPIIPILIAIITGQCYMSKIQSQSPSKHSSQYPNPFFIQTLIPILRHHHWQMLHQQYSLNIPEILSQPSSQLNIPEILSQPSSQHPNLHPNPYRHHHVTSAKFNLNLLPNINPNTIISSKP